MKVLYQNSNKLNETDFEFAVVFFFFFLADELIVYRSLL